MENKKENIQAYVSKAVKDAIKKMAKKETRSVSQMAGIILDKAVSEKCQGKEV